MNFYVPNNFEALFVYFFYKRFQGWQFFEFKVFKFKIRNERKATESWSFCSLVLFCLLLLLSLDDLQRAVEPIYPSLSPSRISSRSRISHKGISGLRFREVQDTKSDNNQHVWADSPLHVNVNGACRKLE